LTGEGTAVGIGYNDEPFAVPVRQRTPEVALGRHLSDERSFGGVWIAHEGKPVEVESRNVGAESVSKGRRPELKRPIDANVVRMRGIVPKAIAGLDRDGRWRRRRLNAHGVGGTSLPGSEGRTDDDGLEHDAVGRIAISEELLRNTVCGNWEFA